MKKLFIVALISVSLVHADGRPKTAAKTRRPPADAPKISTAELKSSPEEAERPMIEARNAYLGEVPVDFVKQADYFNRHRDMLAEIIIVGHLALSFRLAAEKIDDEEGWRHLPGSSKKLKADVRMKIVGLGADLSDFTVDITSSHPFLKGALSQNNSQEFSSRYRAQLVKCDENRLTGEEQIATLRSMIKDLQEENFSAYMGCELELKHVFSEKTVSADPFDFLSDHIDPGVCASAGSEVVDTFRLLIGKRGLATLTSEGNLEATSGITGRPANFTLTASRVNESEARPKVLTVAQTIYDDILKIAEGVEMGWSAEAGPAEDNMVLKAAFRKVSESLRENIKTLRSEFSELSIRDQFHVMMKIGRAYRIFDGAKAAAARHKDNGPKLDLDLEPK